MYDASSIQVLEGLEPIRKRPGMYIGALGSEGLTSLVTGVVDHCLASHRLGETTTIDVSIEGEQVGAPVRIRRDGPGDSLVGTGNRESLLELLLTRISHWAPPPERSFGFPSELLSGLSLPVMHAMSETMEVEVSDGRERRRVRGARGKLWGRPELLGRSDDPSMTFRYRADPQIFGDAPYDFSALRADLAAVAALYPALTLVFQGERIGNGEGLRALHTGSLRRRPIETHAFRDGCFVGLSVGWRADDARPSVRCLLEWSPLREIRAGAPIEGFHAGLLEALHDHVRPDLPASDVRGGWGLGLDAVLHLRVEAPVLRDQLGQHLEGERIEQRVREQTRDSLAGAMARDPLFHAWLRDAFA